MDYITIENIQKYIKMAKELKAQGEYILKVASADAYDEYFDTITAITEMDMFTLPSIISQLETV